MLKTTGGRLAGVFVGFAAIALLGGLAAYSTARPVAEAQIRERLRRDEGSLRALRARLGAAQFSAAMAGRSAADRERDVEYLLQSSDGVALAGRLSGDLALRPAGGGYVRIDRPSPAAAASSGAEAQRLLGRLIGFADGSRLLVAYDIDARVEKILQFVPPVLFAVLSTALAGALAAIAFALQGQRQLTEASRAVNRILAGDLSPRLPVHAGTGFGTFAAELNVALERIERLTVTMRTVADSTAHDLRAPLNRLRATAEYALLGDDDAARLRAALDSVLAEVDRLELTIEALLRIAIAESGAATLAPVDPAQIVADVAELYRPLAEERGQQLTSSVEYDLAVSGNAQLLAQALANLIDNAIKFTPPGGRVHVAVAQRAEGIVLEVADSGPGIAPDDRPRAVERSQRLENAVGTNGSGLGLALVAAVARLHGARLELEDNGPGLRARFVLARA